MSKNSKYLTVICTILLVLIVQFHSKAQVSEGLKLEIDSLLNQFRSDQPGGAVGVYLGNKVVYERYVGLQSLSTKKPITASTPYNIASMAKQFTGVGIALLEHQNKISKEDKMGKYLPELAHFDGIKVKHLLYHTSGLREATDIALLSGKTTLSGELPLGFINEENLLSILSKERDLNFQPGTEHSYTNTNYILLAQIISRISGKPFGTFLDSAIFKPLGMKNSYVQPSASESKVEGHRKKGKRFKKTRGSGGLPGEDNLITTLNDLRLWYGNYFTNRLGLADTLHQNLIKPEPLIGGKSSDYGYGLSITDRNGMLLAWHDGENNLHTSAALFMPESQLIIICLANATDHFNPTRRVFEILEMIYPREKEETKLVKFMKTAIAENEKKQGIYYRIGPTNSGAIRKVSVIEEETFVTAHLDYKGLRFQNVSKDHLYATNTNGNPINLFFEEEDGQPILREDYVDHESDWVFKKKGDFKIQSSDYTGTYKDPFHGAFFQVKEKKGKLIAKKGLLKVELIPFERDVFLGDYDIMFFFERSANGRISNVLLNLDNLRNFQLDKVK